MKSSPRVMLLIDADNVSADVVEQAVGHVEAKYGTAHVRRAYCTAESAVKQLALFKRLSIRPIVNLSTGKNSTDIALAVDAIDLVLAERPDVVVIVSSDSDFAPLVLRLREKGCLVCGIGQVGKTGDDSKKVYDEFDDLEHRRGSRAAKAPAKRSPKAAGASAKAAAHGRTARAAAADVAPIAPAPIATVPELPDEVQRILETVPELRAGAKLELGIVAERLRSEKLLAKSAPSSKLFKKHPELFTLTPDKHPNKVQYHAPRQA